MRETSLALYEFEDHLFDPASGRYHEPVTPVVEIYVVVPAQTGFFVLRDKASLDAVKDREGIVMRIVDPFETLVK